MADRSATVVFGGWDGHEPDKVADLFATILRGEGFEVEVSDTLDAVLDTEKLNSRSLIVPIITMSKITNEQLQAVTTAVAEHGVGLAGCHGGMNDAFREATEWQFMTGGQWVSHPGNDGVKYTLKIDRNNPHPITEGLPDFEVVSEQYFLHVDPGNNVLAYTDFPNPAVPGPHVANPCKMPQVYTKMYGNGRVFYTALGHHRSVLEPYEPRELVRRGCLWAAKGVGL